MINCFFRILLIPLLSFTVPDRGKMPEETFTLPASQLGPVYFFQAVPARIKLNDKVILSFSKSSMISTYRYKLDIPPGKETRIDKDIVSWSSWKTEDIIPIIIPKLDVTGTYKFIVEYKTGARTPTQRFEKIFEVYSLADLALGINPSSEIQAKPEPVAHATTQAAVASNQESGIPIQPEIIPAVETQAADNAAVRNGFPSAIQPDISSASVQRTPIGKNNTRPLNGLKRRAPQIEKLVFPVSGISLFKSGGTIELKEADSPAKEPVFVEKIYVDEPSVVSVLAENTKAPPALPGYNPAPEMINNKALTEETPDQTANTSLTNRIPDTGTHSKIKISDTLISHNEPGPGKSEIQMEDLAASVGTIAGKPESDIAEDYLLKLLPASAGNTAAISFNDLLLRAIEENDTALFRESILNGGGNDLAGINGGNVFHLLNGTIGDEYSIFLLKKNGNSIDKKDRNGNSPLHTAILNRDYRYAKCLINQGADLNLKNKMELAPLHLAAFLNEYRISAFLMAKGAVADIAGNSGYTPLHIASELNNQTIAEQLLDHGARVRQKNDQGLTPVAIAKIQKNKEILRLLTGSGSKETKNNPIGFTGNTNYHVMDPMLRFSLPYNNALVAKRQRYTITQAVTVPIAAILSAGTAYLKSEANKYYSLSKIAETEEQARALYDKTRKLDTSVYVTGSLTLASVYGFIHSTIGKRKVTGKMYKTFN